jgi:hypothetical protein
MIQQNRAAPDGRMNRRNVRKGIGTKGREIKWKLKNRYKQGRSKIHRPLYLKRLKARNVLVAY